MARFGTLSVGLLVALVVSGLHAKDIKSIREIESVVQDCFAKKAALSTADTIVQRDATVMTDKAEMKVSAISDKDSKEARKKDTSEIWLLVLFDLDNVLIQPADTSRIGSDQWFSAVFAKGLDLGLQKAQILKFFLPEHFALQKSIKLTLIEEKEAASFISDLQGLPGVAVMGLTARSMQIGDRTIAELNRLGIDFSKGALCDSAHEKDYLSLSYPACFRGGIVFCGENPKVDMLARVLADVHCNPTHMIFTDDKEHNVAGVTGGMAKKGLHVEGLRYAGSDEEAANFKLTGPWLEWIENLARELRSRSPHTTAGDCKVA